MRKPGVKDTLIIWIYVGGLPQCWCYWAVRGRHRRCHMETDNLIYTDGDIRYCLGTDSSQFVTEISPTFPSLSLSPSLFSSLLFSLYLSLTLRHTHALFLSFVISFFVITVHNGDDFMVLIRVEDYDQLISGRVCIFHTRPEIRWSYKHDKCKNTILPL